MTREEIERGERDPKHHLKLQVSKVVVPEVKKARGPRYTPLSRRQDRPNAILWLVRNHPELKDAQIMRLVGTTKATLKAIRERTHWNSAALTPMDFTIAFAVVAACSLTACLQFLTLSPGAGEAVSGKKAAA